MGINKVNYGNTTLIDTSNVTVTADKLAQGYTALDNTGALITGTASGTPDIGIGTKTKTNSDVAATSLAFKSLSGEPKAFFVRCRAPLIRDSSHSYYYITAIRYNGTNTYGNYWRTYGLFYEDTSHYSFTYSNGTLTVTSSSSRSSEGGAFYNGDYELTYIY